jgi:hypothetical protein
MVALRDVEFAPQEVFAVTLRIAPFAAKTLSDHEIQILYRIDGLNASSGPATTLAELAAAPGIAEDQIAALEGRYGGAKVWKRAASNDAGQDFHRHIREMVSGHQEGLATRWSLDDAARTFVESASLYEQDIDPVLRISKRLVLLLSKSSKERLRSHSIDCDGLVVRIRTIALTLFQTGHGFAVTVVELERSDGAALRALELLEAQILLTRFGKLAWTDARTGDLVRGAPFLLGDLVHRLATGKDVPPHAAQRVTTCTYAQFAEPAPTAERDLFGLHLARHYSTDYVISPDIGGVVFVADFETVRHVVALEGAATIVGAASDPSELASFVRNFKTVAFRRHYVPIALLARHEHAFLVARTSASVLPDDEKEGRDQVVERLERLRGDSHFFRLRYRFSELSFITMHNALNHAFRKVLNLDRMMEELASDVASVEAYIREVRDEEHRRREEEKHRRYYWATLVGGAALAGLTAYTISREIGELGLGLLHEATRHEALPEESKMLAGAIAVVLGLLVSGFTYWLGRRRGPAPHDEGHAGQQDHAGHLAKHTLSDQVIHRALKR